MNFFSSFYTKVVVSLQNVVVFRIIIKKYKIKKANKQGNKKNKKTNKQNLRN